MLACSWIPGIDPDLSVDIGVPNTSSRPDAVRPMKTILSLKTAGSRRGFLPCQDLLLGGEELAELVRRVGTFKPAAGVRSPAPARGS